MAIKHGLRKLTPLKLGPLRQLETFSFIQHPEPALCGDCTDGMGIPGFLGLGLSWNFLAPNSFIS